MGSQISTQISVSSTQNQEIDHYIQYISEHKKKIMLNPNSIASNENNCMSCCSCSGIFGGNVITT